MTRSTRYSPRHLIVLIMLVACAAALALDSITVSHAATITMSNMFMSSDGSSGNPAQTTHFPSNPSSVYFYYTVGSVPAGGSDDTAEVAVFAGGTSGTPVTTASLFVGANASNVPQPLNASYPDGGYCTVVYVDNQAKTALPWSVGSGTAPSSCPLPAGAPSTATNTPVVAATSTAVPTSTSVPAANDPTVAPTFTPLPTYTPHPTSTGTITATPLPTSTAVPTSTPNTGGIQLPPPPPPPGGQATATPLPTNTPMPTAVPAPRLKRDKMSVKGKLVRGKAVTLQVHVQGMHGKPVVGAQVRLSAKSAGIAKQRRANTGKHGIATFKNVKVTKAGTVVIKSLKSGWTTVVLRITVH